MNCPQCAVSVPRDAHFCPQCGGRLVWTPHTDLRSGSRVSGWVRFILTLGLSIGVSLLLSLVFHFPIFLIGAVLPLFWMGRKDRS